MRTAIKKLLVASVACVMGFSMMFGLAACGGGNDGPSDEELITASIDELITAFKDPGSEASKAVLGDIEDADLSQFEEFGVAPYDFLARCFSRAEYTVDAINIEGDTATAELTITNVDLTAAMEAAAGEDLDAFLATDEGAAMIAAGDVTALYPKLMELFYARIDSSETMVSNPATLDFNKVDGQWVASDADIDQFVSALYGGLEF